jgi:hypothetical protein
MTSAPINATLKQRVSNWLQFAEHRLDTLPSENIHIDQLDASYKPKDYWVAGGLLSLEYALSEVDRRRMTVTVALEIFLAPSVTLVGYDVAVLRLSENFSWTPPQLEVFRLGGEPWAASSIHRDAYSKAALPHGISDDLRLRALYQEWFDKSEGEYDRRLWLLRQ